LFPVFHQPFISCTPTCEWAQKEKKSIEFVVIQEVGTGYHKQYLVDVLINQEVAGKGQDYSIKGAEQNAAMKAVEQLGINGNGKH
jgi:dsRNA-specific ribonuclease